MSGIGQDSLKQKINSGSGSFITRTFFQIGQHREIFPLPLRVSFTRKRALEDIVILSNLTATSTLGPGLVFYAPVSSELHILTLRKMTSHCNRSADLENPIRFDSSPPI